MLSGAAEDGTGHRAGLALELALERGCLDQDGYQDAIIKLASLNHQFTSFNAGTLLRSAEKSDWQVTPELDKLLEIVAGPNIEQRSAMSVLAEFHYRLLSGAPRKSRGRIFSASLRVFQKHHKEIAPKIHELLEYIAEHAFPRKTGFDVRRRVAWKEHIDAWLLRGKRRQKSSASRVA